MKKLKLFIEVDLEGVSGAVYGGYNLPKTKEAARAELLMTLELNACVEGARAAGVGEIIVAESHPFNTAVLTKEARIVHGLDELPRCDLLAFVGRHARAGLPTAVLSHTGSSRSVLDFRVNGVAFGEFGITAAYAGHFGVPAVFVSGDRAAVEEAKNLVPGITGVAVSEGLGNHTAICLPPGKTGELIRAGIAQAVFNRKKVRPLAVRTPVRVDYTLKYAAQADRFALVPGVVKTGPRAVSYTCRDFKAAYRTYLATSLALVWWDWKS